MSIGKIEEFVAGKKKWSTYIARLEQFFVANKVDEKMRVPTLLTVVGDDTYELMTNLCDPKKPADVSYVDLLTIMQIHLEPAPSEIAERYKFRSRKQQETESIAEYISELKSLAKHCNFKTNLEENLRDQLVYGIMSDSIKQRLFAEKALSYKTASELAINLERAERDVALLEKKSDIFYQNPIKNTKAWRNNEFRIQHSSAQPSTSSTPTSRRYETRRPSSPVNIKCKHCGRENHGSSDCYFKAAVCNRCKVVGHISRVCNKNKQPSSRALVVCEFVFVSPRVCERVSSETRVRYRAPPDAFRFCSARTCRSRRHRRERAISRGPSDFEFRTRREKRAVHISASCLDASNHTTAAT